MSRKQSQFDQLESLESSFTQRLVKALRRCASGDYSLLFLSREMRPDDLPKYVSSPITDELVALADEILTLRSKLELGAGCLASRFREACRLNADLEDDHRLGAKRLAQQMLAEIENPE